jgi:DNA replication initiation complex subunit (GINS family)
MTEFLSKNADEALVQVKENLYERLEGLRDYLAKMAEWGYAASSMEQQMVNEIQFLEDLLDMIERS